MNNKRSLRVLLRIVSVSATLVLAHTGAIRAADTAIPEGDLPKFSREVGNVSDRLIETYGTTDWSPVTTAVLANPEDPGNAKVFLIPLALGNAFLDRYAIGKDDPDSEKAIQYFESVIDGYGLWQRRALAPMIAHTLVISIERMHKYCDSHWDLPPVQRKQASVLWKNAKAILREEAGYRLTAESSFEPTVWDAALFADAASFLEDEPQAAAWEEKSQQLLYTSLNFSDDLSTPDGSETETLFALRQATVSQRIAGRPVLVEFRPVIDDLSTDSDSGDDDLAWKLPADHSDVIKPTRIRKLFRASVRKPVQPVPVVTAESELLEAVENSKNLLYYVMASYLEQVPATPSCSEVRYTMPEVGEVQ